MSERSFNTESARQLQEVRARSNELNKELRLVDLVFMQFLFVFATTSMGSAAKVGSAHVLFWICGALLFFLPAGLVAIHLSRLMPLEGGVYQWSKLAFNETVGFFVAWNLALSIIMSNSQNALLVASSLPH